MGHLPISKEPFSFTYEPIPYVCRVIYDNGDLMTYPMRIEALYAVSVGGTSPGFLSDQHSRSLRSMSRQEIEPRLQTWLFFDLVHEILSNL